MFSCGSLAAAVLVVYRTAGRNLECLSAVSDGTAQEVYVGAMTRPLAHFLRGKELTLCYYLCLSYCHGDVN